MSAGIDRGRWDWSARLAAVFLLAVHLAVLAAGSLAPDPTVQDRTRPFAPPTTVHLVDAGGRWHLPFVYRQLEAPEPGRYRDDVSRRYPLKLGVRARDPVSGEGSTRLVGVEEPAHLAPMGTDRFGRDLFSRWLHGGRHSLAIGLVAGLLAVGLGILLGGVAGFYGGWVDHLILRCADLMLALPWLYLLLAARALLPLDLEARQVTGLLIAILALLGWAVPARLVRGVALQARESEALLAARGFGAGDLYLIRRHLMPRIRGLAATQLTLRIPRFILAEVTLSFFGIGIAEPTPSWGNLLAELQHFSVLRDFWWTSWPAAMLILVVMSYHRLSTVLQKRSEGG